MDKAMHRGWFTSRGFRLSYLDSAPGDLDRPVILFIHGFPDTAEMWLPQMERLHAQGYRCIASDTLGCGESVMAPRLTHYNATCIAGDHIALLDELGIKQAHLVGHDWGAAIAWLVAGHFPSRVRKLCMLSVGHPMAYARAGMDQKLKAWYIVFFLFAGIAETLLMGDGRLSFRHVFRSHPDIESVISRLSAPGRLTAALRIYRASLPTVLLKPQPRIKADTLGVFSEADAFLVSSQMKNSGQWIDGRWKAEMIRGGHWIPLEQPDWVNETLTRWFMQ
ncbi:alpha/beta fold hydrolase [Algiphilus sp.]|uniref:alpha/beta fold hydrolase n=1 Tax=Algiphilus sp. TaxID=1872431 RepID=UPI0032EE2D05